VLGREVVERQEPVEVVADLVGGLGPLRSELGIEAPSGGDGVVAVLGVADLGQHLLRGGLHRLGDDVLKEAGFDVPSGPPRRRRGAAPAREGRQRAKAVPVDEIKAFVLKQKGTFTLADVMSDAGGSPATVRKAVEELVESGQVEKLGPVPDYSGRGRAPTQYSRS
jgi:hypothetical protein